MSLPEWLRTPASPEQIIDRRLRPSDPAARTGNPFRTGESIQPRARALQRGALVHRLLQSLPDLAAERRREAARDISPAMPATGPRPSARRWPSEMLALIADPALRAGVCVRQPGRGVDRRTAGAAGTAAALVSGQIDRLVVTPTEVLIVDYKTNHAPPDAVAEAPPGYVRQLALYRAVLQKLYPQLPVRAALLWTETPDLMEISTPALDAQLASMSPDERA